MPKYDSEVAVLISTETGAVIDPGATVTTFRGRETKFAFISRLAEGNSQGKVIIRDNPEDQFSGDEVYPSVIGAKIIVRETAGPRWRVMHGEELIGRAEQFAGNPVDTENPRTAADWQYKAMGSAWSHLATQELREVEPGVQAVHAVREPYTHGQGYKHEDTGIRIVDAWLHG